MAAKEAQNLTQTASSFSAYVNVFTQKVEENVGNEHLPDSVKNKIRDEARQYFETGSCANLQDESRGFLNPTMLHPISRKWQVNYYACPFYGYIPLANEEQLDTKASSGILTRSSHQILKTLVSSYRKKMHLVKIFVHLEDSLEFCYRQKIKFDVIDSSYLSDVVGLANIVNACTKILSDHPEAKFFTSTTNWTNLAPTIEEYVEKSLCSPLSLIPTYYGLRLLDHVELGASVLVHLHLSQHMFNLCWKKTPLYRNAALTPCPALHTFINELARICFDVTNLRKDFGLLSGDGCGMMLYSPRTFYYVLKAMVERIPGGEKWLKAALCPPSVSDGFKVMKLVLDAWMDGRSVLKLSTIINSSAALKKSYLSSCIGSPKLRIILRPLSNSGMTVGKNVQYIDNFEFEMEKNDAEEIMSVFVSLLLPLGGFEEKFRASIIDFANGHEIIDLGPLTSFRKEQFRGSYPYPLKRNFVTARSAEEVSQLLVIKCIEDEVQYDLTFKIEVIDGDISGELSSAVFFVNTECTCFRLFLQGT